jgi:hypothetical protein
VGWNQEPYPLILPAAELEVPISGRYAARLGYAADNRHSAVMGQKVTVPLTWPVTLSFALFLYSEEMCDAGYWDTIGTYVNGQALEENSHLCRGNTGGDGWRRVDLDLSAYAGETILLEFAVWTGLQDPLASVAFFDEITIW